MVVARPEHIRLEAAGHIHIRQEKVNSTGRAEIFVARVARLDEAIIHVPDKLSRGREAHI